MMKITGLSAPCALLVAGLLGFAGPSQGVAAPAAGFAPTSYVLLGVDGARIARVITADAACPSVIADGRPLPMTRRAAAETIPQRVTNSAAADSKPSVFDGQVCEAVLPASVTTASVGGRNLPLPPAVIRRIVVIGDTGCRIKKLDNAIQACNDPKAYPFAQVAAAAARWKPDLVVHVGDFLYRENDCAAGNTGCAGTPWGYGADAWRADFFDPAAPLLDVAPLALARGNHESCLRAGQGWWRYLDTHEYLSGRDCNDPAYDAVGDFTDPYAVPLGDNAQLIFLDSADAPSKPLAEDDLRAAHYRDAYAKIAVLAAAAPHSIMVNHHPVFGFAAKADKATGQISLMPGNGGLQSVFGALNPRYLPAGIDVSLAGHIHVWEALSFSSDHPAQIVAGFSGTQEDIVPLPASLPADVTPAKGAVVKTFSSWVDGFGFMTLERRGDDAWDIEVHDVAGAVVNTCKLHGKDIACALPQVPSRH